MKLLLSNGREVVIDSCPMDERGDKLDSMLSALDYDKMSFHQLREAYRDIALEAIALFSPALDRKAALGGLNFKICLDIIKALHGRD